MNKFCFTLSFCLFFLSLFSQSNPALQKILQNEYLSHSSLGICIIDENGKNILQYNDNLSLTPASVLKVITTATAIDILGSDFKYKTQLGIDKENKTQLIVVGSGDPTLGSEYVYDNPRQFLEIWKEKIKSAMSNSITEILIDDSYFGYNGTSMKWLKEDLGNYYAAGAYGVSIFDNSYRLYFNTQNTGSQPEIIKTEPAMNELKFTNRLTLNTTGKDNGYINGETFSETRTLNGNIPTGKSSFSIKGDIPNPGKYLGEVLGNYFNLSTGNIHTVQEEYFTNYPAHHSGSLKANSTEIFHTHFSPSLKNIVKVINVRSNNHYSEHLIRTIGRNQNKNIYADPLQEGTKAIKNYWQEKGINSNALFMYDGCGLAPSNAISPRMLCEVLRYMYKESLYSSDYIASFPKAGQEGTVRNFLKDTRLAGKVYVKSGSIAHVQCYAGYYMQGDKKYIFAVMVNNFDNEQRRKVVNAIENLLLETLK